MTHQSWLFSGIIIKQDIFAKSFAVYFNFCYFDQGPAQIKDFLFISIFRNMFINQKAFINIIKTRRA